jgi:Transposase DDE domain
MKTRSHAVHVVTTQRKYKDRIYEAHLLRRSYREDGKVKNETIANISKLPKPVIELIRRSLRGEQFVGVDELFDVESSPQHGNVLAVLGAMRALGFADLIASQKCRERDLAIAMVASRILGPQSKLATTRWWHTTTLPQELGIENASEEDLYGAMDWLLARQPHIEKKLAKRHLREGGLVLYDLSSSYFEGTQCPLAARGYSRDKKKGKLQVNYGLITDGLGCPVSVSVFPGNTSDSTTLLEQVDKARNSFGLESLVIVGDRGMITQKQIDQLETEDGIGWITALKTEALRDLTKRGALQLGLFDEQNLFEFTDPDRPGERFVACRNLDLADRRVRKRQSLLDATVKQLDRVRSMVKTGKLEGKDKIGVRVGKVINKFNVAKHFTLKITNKRFSYEIDEARVAAEAALDGVYVIRTNVDRKKLTKERAVLAYKQLTSVERAFRSLKTMDLHVRPIYHWSDDRVRAHIFLCMLAYYVEYHMLEAWRPLLFSDEEARIRADRDPVTAATRSDSAMRKAQSKRRSDGEPCHSFQTLLADLGGIVRNTCRRKGASAAEPSITMMTKPNQTQSAALELVAEISSA